MQTATLVDRTQQTRDPDQRKFLLVIGGLPRSGRTTLLRWLLTQDVSGVERFDSEQVTSRLRAAGIGVPYRLLRPWVHLRHRWRVLRGIGSNTPVVVLTDPWTSSCWRAAVVRCAAWTGRGVQVMAVDPSQELGG